MKSAFAFLLGALAGLIANNHSSAADWPQWRGPLRNGQVENLVALTESTKIEQLWQAEIGTGFSSVSVMQNRVVSSGNIDNQDIITCLDLNDGRVIWTHSYAAPLDPNLFEGGPTATPTLHGESVFTISRAGEIYCLAITDGTVRWHTQVPQEQRDNAPSWGYSGSALIHGDNVIFNTGAYGLCLNAATGETVWQSPNEEMAGYTSPLLMQAADSEIVLIESERSINAVNPTSGELLWKHPWITRYGINAADPLVLSPQQVLLTSGYAKGASLLDLTSEKPKELWRSRDLKSQMSPGVLINGFVYANDGDAGQDCKLVCVRAETGKLQWLERGFGSASLIAVGRQLILLSEVGELVIIDADPAKMKVVAKSTILSGKCWTPPTYTDSKVLARNATGKLVCIKLIP